MLKSNRGIVALSLMLTLVYSAVCTGGAGPTLPKEVTTESGVKMVLLPGGTFVMGVDDGEVDEPAHEVTVAPFAIDKFEVTQEEYERVMAPNPNRVVFSKKKAAPFECRHWLYVLNLLGAEALGAYEKDYYAGKPAITRHKVGKGQAIYIGSMFDPDDLKRVAAALARLAGLDTLDDGWPEEIERVRLQDANGKPIWVLLNHAHEPRGVTPPEGKSRNDHRPPPPQGFRQHLAQAVL